MTGSRVGYTTTGVERTFARARTLCDRVDEPFRRFLALRGLHFFHQFRAELGAAIQLGEEMLAIAEQRQDPALLIAAHQILGQDLLFIGELERARAHLEQGMALFTSERTARSENPEGIFGYAGRVLWLLGYPDQARARARQSLDLARADGRPVRVATVLYFAAMLHQNLRDATGALALTREGLALSETHGLVQRRAQILAVHGWALAAQGQPSEGIDALHEALSNYRATGAELGRPNYLAMLAEAAILAGRAEEEGAVAVAEALSAVERTSQRSVEAELHRLRGEILVLTSTAGGMGDGAERCFRRAREVAQRLGARALELRAAMSLARYWRTHGRAGEARELVRAVHAEFTEGFDTPDILDAAALLQAPPR